MTCVFPHYIFIVLVNACPVQTRGDTILLNSLYYILWSFENRTLYIVVQWGGGVLP